MSERRGIFRFATIGVFNTVLDAGIFSLLFIILSWHELTANTLSYIIVVSISFLLNRHWAFSHLESNKSNLVAYGQFFITSLGSLVFTTLILIIGKPYAPILLLKGAALLLGPLFNFLAYRFIVFAPRSAKSNESHQ